VNHRIFERTLRLLVFREACLFECHETSILHGLVTGLDLDLGVCRSPARLKDVSGMALWLDVISSVLLLVSRPLRTRLTILLLTSNQVGLPAELKHINKRRKRN